MADFHPFDYDLHLFSILGTNSRMMICCHGYGDSHLIAEKLKTIGLIDSTLVSFNFPDYDLQNRDYDPNKASFGTVNELLPICYVLKKYVVDDRLDSIDLYGRSAGGGAVVNLLAILNTATFDTELAVLGICQKEKKQLLAVIQKGIVILDVPLKSVEEIIACRGSSPELEILAKSYRDNLLRPIDSLESLKGLSLHVILHFQKPDEIIFNRDDPIYIEKLKNANCLGTTRVIIDDNGGHQVPSRALWKLYSEQTLRNSKT